MVRTADIEVIPLRDVGAQLGTLPKGSTVTVTCSPKLGLERTLECAAAAVEAGYAVTPHLGARQVRDEAHLRQVVARLDGMGVRRLYVIGGDVPKPVGAFTCAAEVLESLSAMEHGLEEIGVACYPEGHPSIPEDVLVDALRRKQPLATYMVTQLCFHTDTLLAWLRRARALGISLPVRLGLAAPLKTAKLMDLSFKIGVGSSIRYLTKQHGLAGTMLQGRSYRPERLLRGMVSGLSDPTLGVEGLHVFTFNQIAATVAWQERIARAAEGLAAPSLPEAEA